MSSLKLLRLSLPLLAAAALFATGCTNGTMTSSNTNSGSTGPAFVVGTDAPLASVVSFLPIVAVLLMSLVRLP